MIFSQPRDKIVLAGLLLSACAASDPSHVPVTMMGTQGLGSVQEMTVRAGQTPEVISKQSGLDISQLLQMNGLVSQQALTPGQRIKVPIPDEIHVIEGDTIDTIAKAFGLDRNAIAQENNLKPPYVLTKGQLLKLPQPTTDNQTSVAAAPVTQDNLTPVATDTVQSAPSSPITTTETTAGAKIHSSASGTITEEDLAPPPGAAQSTTPPPQAQQLALASPAPASAQPAAKAVQTLGTGTPSFSWPVNGSTLSSYGGQANGVRNDGLDIGAPQGSAVRAAAAGEVVYTGNNVAGFGNLILIRHSGGFATAYGHVQNPLVKRGDHVTAGQSIAQIGKTGNVTRPQLHFEIRKGTEPVDPKTYLP